MFSLLFSFAEPFCCKTRLMFFSFFEAGRKIAQQFLFHTYICLFMFFFALTCGSLFFLHPSAKIENAICSLNTSGGPEKTFR